MKKVHLLALAIAVSLTACKKETKNNTEEKNATPIETVDSHTAENALDWNGTYNGILPCNNCPGVITTIKLNNDKTFEKAAFYIDTKDGYINEKGTFSFTEDGGTVILKSDKATTKLAVGENRLELLNEEGKRNSSESAVNYQLRKMRGDKKTFNKETVKGILTLGHEVSVFRPCGSANIFWINDTSENTQLEKLYNEHTKSATAPYTPVLAELVLQNNDKPRQGFSEEYDDVLDVISINSVEKITPDNFCDK